MKRIGYSKLAFLAALALVGNFATSASATPLPNSAIVLERLYNDCPISTVSSVNAYPGSISISDSWNGLCVGYANGHAWNFSGDGGATSLNLGNNGSYKFKATLTLTASSGTVEGGIHIAPWWNNMDGRFQARIPDGEVACFGGRLPFYSFTASNGVVYVAGTPITMEIEYLANKLSSVSPASIQYRLTYGVNSYSSPVLLFDQGNAAEDPPHGQWGALDPALAGGVVQVNNGSGGAGYNATWTDVEFTILPDANPPLECTTFLDELTFLNYNKGHGKLTKGTETFEEGIIVPGGKNCFPAPLGVVPNKIFPNGLEAGNLIIQDNITTGPNPPTTHPSGDPCALYAIGPGFIGSNSIKVGEDLFLQGIPASLDLIFTEPNHTGVSFKLSRFDGFPTGGWHVTVYDKGDQPMAKVDVAVPGSNEPFKGFFGVWCNRTIGRINIYDQAGIAPDAVDDINMWLERPTPTRVTSWGGLKVIYR